ncbi:hypothetical protein CONCODRAFT_13781 [Conidiobolus coronatus NRRL 28638]|uniref:Uncharacterized protein n=1 Tax=Conidiobolus coronatus (strain ATCC 28846 / CBS 209.66 / NRRL 28638) TaxID=796925 RepID=A0A137NQ45_CONC2|nr:hypothetical protein CONCODRAFT_13781 [Conidiobolus coronatus NRRL 28638]|eukprot:KXN64866.1 hypothetical protein CONCODRAFT_13781 [Conidiobolus coronatus NRRL 28638]
MRIEHLWPNIPVPMTRAIANYNVSSNRNEVGTSKEYIIEERKNGILGQFRGSNKFSHHLTAYRLSKHKEYLLYDAEGKENVHSYLDRIFIIKGLNRDDY